LIVINLVSMIHARTYQMKFILLVFTVLGCINGISQKNATIVDTSKPSTATVIAGEEYKRGGLWKVLWGEHYRKEWTLPVTVQKIYLDTAFGGLKPMEKGGGRQTKNLRLDAPNKRQYAIRSINKDYGKALPDVAQGTFIESIVKDQMSVAHPYAGPTVKALADAVKVYNTDPKIVFIGEDPKLGKFEESFKNDLYSLEDRPTGKNARFYGAKDVLDTEDLLKELLKDNDHRVDAISFLRARLFDMFIGDWDRHDDQWKWAEYENGGKHVYKALPKDRDQVYSKFDGVLLGIVVGAAHLPYLKGFKNDIKDIEGFNLEARPLDMQILSELPLDSWNTTAMDMQKSLTDAVIENAIKIMPAEVYDISGKEIIEKLKSRRNHLTDFATRYYESLSKNVDIIATEKDELIEVTGVDDMHVKVSLFDLNKSGNAKSAPYYSRVFNSNETKEIRIYGIGGNDKYEGKGKTQKKILVRLIGGKEKDDYNISSTYNGKIHIYDNPDNSFNTSSAKKYLSTDTSINRYERKAFKPNNSGLGPRLGYSNEDRIFVGIGYKKQVQQWRKLPFGYSHDIAALYSLTQKAFRFVYKGTFNEAIGKWNVGLLADYDQVRDLYFMGIGNNTEKLKGLKKDYYLYRNKEFDGAVSLYRTFDSTHTITFSALYQMVELLNDNGRFLSNYYGSNPKQFSSQQFAGIRGEYDFSKINDRLVPNKGIRFHAGAEYFKNVKNTNDVARYTGMFGFYLPIGPLTLAVKTGAGTLTGEPEFYQLNKIGGGTTVRGFTRYRFYGKTMFYNQNELQWNFNVKTYLFNGKMGLVALFDNGRVWNPGEISDQWHTAIGGGLMIAPFNMISVTGTYAVSKEDQRFSLRIGHLLKK
jgi:hypothetical protein